MWGLGVTGGATGGRGGAETGVAGAGAWHLPQGACVLACVCIKGAPLPPPTFRPRCTGNLILYPHAPAACGYGTCPLSHMPIAQLLFNLIRAVAHQRVGTNVRFPYSTLPCPLHVHFVPSPRRQVRNLVLALWRTDIFLYLSSTSANLYPHQYQHHLQVRNLVLALWRTEIF